MGIHFLVVFYILIYINKMFEKIYFIIKTGATIHHIYSIYSYSLPFITVGCMVYDFFSPADFTEKDDDKKS
jgi:hypothetical protein